MLLAIDIGNTHTVFAVNEGDQWLAIWRRPTHADATEDLIAVWLRALFNMSCLEWRVTRAICSSVVPALNGVMDRFCEQWLQVRLQFLTDAESVGLKSDYEGGLGSDRIANVLGALAKYDSPFIIVDCGTATTLEVVDATGTFIGGAIMPGLEVMSQALTHRTSQLPQIELSTPDRVLGKNTRDAVRSGLMYGYAGGIDALIRKISCEAELHEPMVIATGGLGSLMLGPSCMITEYDPTLTLDGLAIAADRLSVIPQR